VNRIVGRPSHFFLRIFIAAIFIVPATLAQQAQPPPPAPAPAESQADKPKDAKEDPDKKTTDDQIGKSKLEKETGTINDRIFEVMPNYGTVETSQILPPLTTGQKFRLATAGVFDWTAYPFNGALAAVAQAKNDPKSWGQGWGAYGKRYGESFADNSIGTYMTTAIFPSLLHEDPRYYQLGRGSFAHRAYHAVNRLFVIRTDSGHDRFNISESLGNAVAAGIYNIYHPAEDRTVSRNLETLGMLILWDGVGNEMKEFWPDIRRKVLHKRTPQE
jgi:hypothetical protein